METVTRGIESASRTARETGPQEDKMKPCRVLLIEDDLDDQVLAKKRLSRSGMVEEVLCFTNGTELIQYLYDQGFHDRSVWCMTPMIIILDLNMPLMDGFAVLQELKSDAFLSEIPVIVVTGTQSPEDVKKAFGLKADAVFQKPIDVTKFESFFKQAWTWPRKDMWYY
jgi:two-component system response regulator